MDNRLPLSSPSYEAPAWKSIEGTWRKVYGNFPERGISIEWHDFSNLEDLNWAKSFHPLSMEICLNFSGQASLRERQEAHSLSREQIAIYGIGNGPIEAQRFSGHQHRFFTLEFSVDFLRSQLETVLSNLRPEICRFLENPNQAHNLLFNLNPMPAHLLCSRLHLLNPPVFPTAHDIWYQSKVMEIFSYLFFQPKAPTELFCEKYNRLKEERCERVLFLLERDLENPPSLEMLAKEVQCSPFYLSRIFIQQTGFSIPRYLRIKRIEKAAELLRAGKMNVTEVAMAVGYASISSFNKAFGEYFGCCPGLYRNTKNLLHCPLLSECKKGQV